MEFTNKELNLIQKHLWDRADDCMGPIAILPNNTWKHIIVQELHKVAKDKYQINDTLFDIFINKDDILYGEEIFESYYVINADVEEKKLHV